METRQDLVCSPYWQEKNRKTINSQDSMGGSTRRQWFNILMYITIKRQDIIVSDILSLKSNNIPQS